ncbi:hypothetical protein DPMN_034254 [Dreissena polymorpha]|uniref:Uncharacterized protein n=1 Tax=Dreissena polymorpha TaxID=45954 RepID=A0A9D4M7A2_DREPO|nr:hypothetical protein DPMN_034254 [Dreissena polymorpha]
MHVSHDRLQVFGEETGTALTDKLTEKTCFEDDNRTPYRNNNHHAFHCQYIGRLRQVKLLELRHQWNCQKGNNTIKYNVRTLQASGKLNELMHELQR